ncbi:MAG: hypothetical protein NXI10_03375 [bacterium]|nr:hypothetical protein [bacterium]
MKYLLITGGLFSMFLFTGCSSPESKAEDRAEEICDCVKAIGINEDMNLFSLQDRSVMRDIERKAERELPRELLKVLKKIEEDIEKLSKEEKKEYTRALMKSMMDTDCADMALDNIPYDMLGLGIDMMEEQLDRQERFREEYDGFEEY